MASALQIKSPSPTRHSSRSDIELTSLEAFPLKTTHPGLFQPQRIRCCHPCSSWPRHTWKEGSLSLEVACPATSLPWTLHLSSQPREVHTHQPLVSSHVFGQGGRASPAQKPQSAPRAWTQREARVLHLSSPRTTMLGELLHTSVTWGPRHHAAPTGAEGSHSTDPPRQGALGPQR